MIPDNARNSNSNSRSRNCINISPSRDNSSVNHSDHNNYNAKTHSNRNSKTRDNSSNKTNNKRSSRIRSTTGNRDSSGSSNYNGPNRVDGNSSDLYSRTIEPPNPRDGGSHKNGNSSSNRNASSKGRGGSSRRDSDSDHSVRPSHTINKKRSKKKYLLSDSDSDTDNNSNALTMDPHHHMYNVSSTHDHPTNNNDNNNTTTTDPTDHDINCTNNTDSSDSPNEFTDSEGDTIHDLTIQPDRLNRITDYLNVRPTNHTDSNYNNIHPIDSDVNYQTVRSNRQTLPGPPSILPTHSTVTYNVTSLSAYPTSHKSMIRQNRVISEIKSLTKNAHLILLQETRLNPSGKYGRLHAALPGWKIYYSNPTNNAGGVCTLVSPYLRSHYNSFQDPLPPSLRGQALSIRFEGRQNGNTTKTPVSFRALNVYLATGTDHHNRRAHQLKLLNRIPNDMHMIMGGDFNFVECPKDTTNYSQYHHLKKGASKQWERLKRKQNLWEVPQDVHTNIAINNDDPHKTRTSRIDRFYISLTEAECTEHSPHTHTVHTNFSITNSFTNNNANNAHQHNSTHVPVALHFSADVSTARNANRYRLPDWIPKTPTYQRIFKALWHDVSVSFEVDPYHERMRFKSVAKQAHRQFKRETRDMDQAPRDHLDKLTRAIQIYRSLISTRTPATDHDNIIRANPDLAPLITNHNSEIEISKIKDFINLHLSEGHPGPGLTAHAREGEDRSEGSAIFCTRSRNGRNHTEDIMHLLPSTKTNLHTLRTNSNEEVTTDRRQQAKMVKDFWGQLWKPRSDMPDAHAYDSYLSNYNKRIPHDRRPIFPSEEDVIAKLKVPRTSKHGPDGLPFSLYRELREIAGPVLLYTLFEMSTSRPAPKGFNKGDLYVFPKDNSSLVAKTRPITVNNVENRIIAGVIADAIMPAVDYITESGQKGFVTGRKGEDNIDSLTDLFYSKLNSQKQHYFLFVDTKKAFDSLDHPYMFAVLRHIGMPDWVINVIQALMTDVKVNIILGGAAWGRITILRGVKQGCPLSPILFVLTYDPLLHRLSLHAGTKVWAFADDTAVGHADLETINDVTIDIDIFSRLSGFGVNTDKSTLLHAIAPTAEERSRVKGSNWPDIALTSQAVYLGVLVGYDIDSCMIYDKAFTKFRNRVQAYARALSHLSIQKRIIIFNIYLLTLFSYLIHFYMIPEDLGKKIRDICRRHIINFNGGGFKYIHLITPSSEMGFKTPLRDPWAVAVSTLASKFDLNRATGVNFAVVREKPYLNDSDQRTPFKHDPHNHWDSLIIDDHRASAALDILNDLGPRREDGSIDRSAYDVSRYKPHRRGRKLRQIMYSFAMTAWSEDRRADIASKIEARGMIDKAQDQSECNPQILTDNYYQHGHNLLPTLTSSMITLQRHILFNSIATDTRRSKFAHLTPRGPRHNPFPCYMCGQGEDSAPHFFGSCPITTRARNYFSTAIGVPLLHDPYHYGLACDPGSKENDKRLDNDTLLKTKRTNATIIFNWSIWHCRSTYFNSLSRIPDTAKAADRITKIATTHWNRIAPPNWRTKRNRISPPDLAISNPALFGSSKRRTKEQQRAALKYTKDLIASFPSHHHIAYTDGSCKMAKKGKKKRTLYGGAGVYLSSPAPSSTHAYASNDEGPRARDEEATKRIDTEDIAPLGEYTNNQSELWAIGMAVQLFLLSSTKKNDVLHIMSDSMLSTLVLEYGSKPKKNKELVKAVRHIISKAHESGRQIIIHWVPGHAGVNGNEHADLLANKGSDIERSLRAKGKSLTANGLARRASASQFLFHHG